MTAETGNEFLDGGELSEDIKELVGVLRESNAAADRLVAAVEADGRRRDFWTKVILGFVAFVVLLVLGVAALVLVVVNRQSESAGRGITIKDCVVPGGDCYARVQQQKREEFNRQTILAIAVATCGQQDPTHLEACVRKATAAADTPSSSATPAP